MTNQKTNKNIINVPISKPVPKKENERINNSFIPNIPGQVSSGLPPKPIPAPPGKKK